MRTKRAILLALLPIAFLAWFAWQMLRPPEPAYQGKRLSLWLEEAFADPGGRVMPGSDWDRAEAAVREIGTNAIPTLMRMIDEKPSALTIKLMSFARKLSPIRIPFPSLRASRLAVVGFEFLGDDARDAVPSLIDLYDRNASKWPQLFTVQALGFIGPAARQSVPRLLGAATKAGVGFRIEAERLPALKALGKIHAEPQLVVPALIKVISDTNAPLDEQISAADALQSYGWGARPAASALVALLKQHDQFRHDDVRHAAVKALITTHAEPQLVVPALITVLRNRISSRDELSYAAAALQGYGAEARPAVSALVELLRQVEHSRGSREVAVAVREALQVIDPEGAAQAGVK